MQCEGTTPDVIIIEGSTDGVDVIEALSRTRRIGALLVVLSTGTMNMNDALADLTISVRAFSHEVALLKALPGERYPAPTQRREPQPAVSPCMRMLMRLRCTHFAARRDARRRRRTRWLAEIAA